MIVAIPTWNALGVLPPIDPIAPTQTHRSPYRVTLIDVVKRFASSPDRRRILCGWLQFRAQLHSMDIKQGFQWLDGSFMENVELRERRSPRDMDVVTFIHTPSAFDPTPDQLASIDHETVKNNFLIDSYFVEVDQISPAELVRQSAYWYSMWSHKRNQTWKGYLEVDLAPIADQQAMDWLNQQPN